MHSLILVHARGVWVWVPPFPLDSGVEVPHSHVDALKGDSLLTRSS